MGMTDKSVIDKMTRSQNEIGAGSISQLRGSAKNQDCIDKEKDRAKAFERDFDDTIKAAERINKREPLMGRVFPKAQEDATRYAFKGAYEKEVSRLPNLMGAET